MAITCPRCGLEFDATLFQFGHRVRCTCGAEVEYTGTDLRAGHVVAQDEHGAVAHEDRCVGCLLGTACGDILGAAVEGWPASAIHRQFGKLHNFLGGDRGFGCYTDDTQMTLALASSLVECGRVDAAHVSTKYAEFYEPWRGYGGAAHTVMRALRSGADYRSREINHWVEEQTNDKIKDLIPPGSLDALTRLVLTNAVYFKGDWVQPFDKRNTREEDFTVSAQGKVKVPLMHQRARMGYTEEETFQALEMPYAGRDLSMVVLLPKKVGGLPELEKAITVDKLASLMSKLHVREVITYLPKFKLETSFGLNPTLGAMGMKRAFSQAADFSGISSVESLYISAVLHEAYVDVNEEGTEAAAATGVMVGAMAARLPQPIPVFRADHPFLFLIHDTKAGSILFMGRLTNPTK